MPDNFRSLQFSIKPEHRNSPRHLPRGFFTIALILSFISRTACGAEATGDNSVAIGVTAVASGEFATALGAGTGAFEPVTTAVGATARAMDIAATAIGAGSTSSTAHSLAVGAYSSAAGELSTALGDSAIASGAKSTTVGQFSVSEGNRSTVVGSEARAIGVNGVALGSNSRAENNDEVNIGYWEKREGAYQQIGTRTISGLSDGVRDDNAVTKGQLDRAIENISGESIPAMVNEIIDHADEGAARTLEEAASYTTRRAVQAETNAEARSNGYTDRRFGQLKHLVDRHEKRANGGIAGAMAMSGISPVPGKDFSLGIAASGYRDQGAIAIGAQASIAPNTNINIKAAWDSGNGVGAVVGLNFGW